MQVSPNTQAVLLLTSHFAKQHDGAVKPLTAGEWGRFAEWLRGRSLTPEQLLQGDPRPLLSELRDQSVSGARVLALLERGSALALSVEKWLRAGLWVMTRSDPDYPRRLKQRLRGDSPAILFGCGDRALLGRGGLAVVGSRNAGEADLALSRGVGARSAAEGYSIVSGGARGVDEAAMLGALDSEGTAIGVLADSLLRSCAGLKFRRFITAGQLVLVSPFNPEAGFNAGHAMQRNRYIYCLADAALAVHSGRTGGTWNGAHEDLRRGWVPLWVKVSDDPEAGNADLIAAGGRPLPAVLNELRVQELMRQARALSAEPEDLFAAAPAAKPGNLTAEDEPREPAPEPDVLSAGDASQEPAPAASVASETDLAAVSFYQLFVAKAQRLCAGEPLTAERLGTDLEINKGQLALWLKRALSERRLEKLDKPVRYRTPKGAQGSLPFD